MNVNKLKKTLSVLLIAAFMLSAAGCSMIDYKKAEKLKNDGDYAAAQEMYIALGDYKDSAELADEWLATGRFVESDGALYAACADRGSDITIDTESYLVAWNGDAGEIMQTITRREWNDETGDFVPVPGSETYYAYPFTTMNRHAVFSAFPCPY